MAKKQENLGLLPGTAAIIQSIKYGLAYSQPRTVFLLKWINDVPLWVESA